MKIAKEKINSGKYNTVILDEINYAIKLNLITESDVVNLLEFKPIELNIIMTGNHVTDKILQLTDIVTEMREVKHPYKKGIKAEKGNRFLAIKAKLINLTKWFNYIEYC